MPHLREIEEPLDPLLLQLRPGPFIVGVFVGSFIAHRRYVFGRDCRFGLRDLLHYFLHQTMGGLELGQ